MTGVEFTASVISSGVLLKAGDWVMNAWKTRYALKRAELGLPLTDRELARLPEIERLRYQVDQLVKKVEELYVQLGTLRSEGARSAAEVTAAKLVVEGITRERDSLAAQLEETTTERDAGRASIEELNAALHATRLQLEQAEERLSAVGRTDTTGQHRPLRGR